jgi:hypothetical protein
MEITVVSRTSSNGDGGYNRILESVHCDKDEAETARQDIIKRYDGAPSGLCTDTEAQTFELDVWVATETSHCLSDGSDPETDVLCVGSRDKCIEVAQQQVDARLGDVDSPCDDGEDTNEEFDPENGWSGCDSQTDTCYVVQVQKA